MKNKKMKRNSTEKVKQVMEYIDSNFDQNITIRQLSNLVSLSYHHLCKVFKKETGETILRYLHKKRIENVCDLLERTDESVEEIALKNGYMNLTKFYKRFKELMKMTPISYRRQQKNR